MSDESTFEAPAAEEPVAANAAPATPAPASAPATAEPVPAAQVVTRTWGGVRPSTWAAAVAVALVCAVVLSGVSFGAGVFVGRQADRFGGRGQFAAASDSDTGWRGAPGQGAGDAQSAPRLQGRQQGQGWQDPQQGGPRGMMGGRGGFPGSQAPTATPPASQ